jgi:hypothetical protein
VIKVISIELTEEQCKVLRSHQIGVNGNIPIYEQIIPITLELTETDYEGKSNQEANQ